MYKYSKRFIDFVISFLGLVVLSPLFFVLCVFGFFSCKGNPIFIQQRIGRRNKNFNIIKFKSMNDRKDSHGNLLSDKERMTKLGSFLRKTSLDELPQLINVLKGDMSLVGPRPLLPKYLSLYTDFQMRRHEVKPGITGWAQVNGRNAISWEKKFEYDIWYVDHLNFWQDCKIIWLTIIIVLKSEGINTKGLATTEPFNGNN